MSKTKKLSKVLALVIMLALLTGILPMGAMATATNTASFSYSSDPIVATAEVAGGSTGTLLIIDKVGPTVEGNTKSCQIELSPNSTATTATVTLKDSSNNEKATLTVNLRSTTPSTTYVATAETTLSKQIDANTTIEITYVFTFVMETSYTVGGTPHNSVYISLPDDAVGLGSTTSTASPFVYSGATTLYSGFPQYVSLRLVPGGSSYDNVSDVQVAVTTGSTSGVEIEHQAGTYYTIYFPSSGSKAVFTVNYKLNGVSQSATTFSITMSYSTPPDSDPTIVHDIYAYLPAPGQFTNEGINTGGWGDAFVSGSGNLKEMVDSIATTGVSLGFFGGYVVLDMGDNISDSPNNLYGIDLNIYGNAFINNSEPGCIQVAQALGNDPGDPDKDGVIWYDIAGSLYYDSDTNTNYSLTYRNPHEGDDANENWPQSGTVSSPNSSNNVPYTIGDGTTDYYVTYNIFHKHAWFPLWANYFVARTTGSGNNQVTIGPMDKAIVNDETSNPVDPRTGFLFADYTRNTSTGSKLKMTGVLLGDATSTNTGLYRFGYADVHPKYTTDATHYDKAYNPYAFTDSDITSNNTWNSFLATAHNNSAAGGGDPIDIAWAVYPAKYDHTITSEAGSYTAGVTHPKAGEPAGLTNIRFIRIYTGGAYMNGIFGELSTEVCGVYKAASEAASVGTTSAPSVSMTFTSPLPPFATTTHSLTLPTTSGNCLNSISDIIGWASGATSFDVSITASNGDNVFVNGTRLTETGTGVFTGTLNVPSATQKIQILVQSGNAAPYIVVLK